MRRYYTKEDVEFGKLVAENPDFAPRARLFYSAREAEQDAYYWFQLGQNVVLRKYTKLMEQLNKESC